MERGRRSPTMNIASQKPTLDDFPSKHFSLKSPFLIGTLLGISKRGLSLLKTSSLMSTGKSWMDQSWSRMTSHGRHPDWLASPDEDSEDKLMSDTDESLEEYFVLGLDKSSFKPIRIDRVHSLVASLSLDIPTYKRWMKAKILLHFLRVQTNKKEKEREEKRRVQKRKIDWWIIPRKQTSNKTDEAKVQTKLKINNWALGLGWKIFWIMRIIMAMDYL